MFETPQPRGWYKKMVQKLPHKLSTKTGGSKDFVVELGVKKQGIETFAPVPIFKLEYLAHLRRTNIAMGCYGNKSLLYQQDVSNLLPLGLYFKHFVPQHSAVLDIWVLNFSLPTCWEGMY